MAGNMANLAMYEGEARGCVPIQILILFPLGVSVTVANETLEGGSAWSGARRQDGRRGESLSIVFWRRECWSSAYSVGRDVAPPPPSSSLFSFPSLSIAPPSPSLSPLASLFPPLPTYTAQPSALGRHYLAPRRHRLSSRHRLPHPRALPPVITYFTLARCPAYPALARYLTRTTCRATCTRRAMSPACARWDPRSRSPSVRLSTRALEKLKVNSKHSSRGGKERQRRDAGASAWGRDKCKDRD
ncbi:hypothetical protein B0H12DRAFT_544848 [Mycena haematopus]|nr:hypothetical protein B0H12DRAFT_544848 [Mycena haematopus]